jgi:membrane fusion protein (multidrug efflux system)
MGSRTAARIPFIIAILLLGALVARLNWPSVQVQKKKSARLTSVVVNEVKRAPFRDLIEAIGTSIANEQVAVLPRYAGLVKTVNFADGQQIKAGQILVSLHNDQEVAEVRELTANLAQAQSQLKRLEDLRHTNATSQSLLEEQQAKATAVSAQLEKATAKLAELNIKAAFNGVLGLRNVSPGAYISTSDVITTLDDISVIKVDFTVPERNLTTVAIGQTIQASNIAYQGQIFSGKITSINSRLDVVTRAVKVRAEIINNDLRLRPGMLLNILLERSVEETMMIPESAVIPIEDKHYVYVTKAGVANRIAISIGRRRPGFVEVIRGLQPGQQVVTQGAIKLTEGSKVKLKGEQL